MSSKTSSRSGCGSPPQKEERSRSASYRLAVTSEAGFPVDIVSEETQARPRGWLSPAGAASRAEQERPLTARGHVVSSGPVAAAFQRPGTLESLSDLGLRSPSLRRNNKLQSQCPGCLGWQEAVHGEGREKLNPPQDPARKTVLAGSCPSPASVAAGSLGLEGCHRHPPAQRHWPRSEPHPEEGQKKQTGAPQEGQEPRFHPRLHRPPRPATPRPATPRLVSPRLVSPRPSLPRVWEIGES
ncbi:uncharacterized protein LOC125619736 [Marmota marmota marmota]|uniref:uncharacterized protein LOC125619736 n=1 Tax=Marmota marmota marmota TaxID=9994 RepID=UPI0020923022|nr:uncharacterized protein LOC125619736 [Marmota marmota marmota]